MRTSFRLATPAVILLMAATALRAADAQDDSASSLYQVGQIDLDATDPLSSWRQQASGVIDDSRVEQAAFLENQLPAATPPLRRQGSLIFNRTDYPTLNWSGFLQLDSGEVLQDHENIATVGNIDAQVGLRRVRLRVFGDLRPETHYVVDLDFAASGHPSFRDVVLGFRTVPYVQNASFGYFKQPFGMDAESSGQELLFMERQSPFAFAPFRQTGFGIHGTHLDETVTYSLSGYTFPTDSFGVGVGNGAAASMRMTALPYVDDHAGQLIHVGIGYGLGQPSDSVVRYAIQPGFFVTDPASEDEGTVPVFVDTGEIPTKLYQLLNFEFAAAAGPFRWQSETRFAFVDQIGGPDLGFSGSYFQMGLVLTGERPEYDKSRAIFHRVVPDNPFGFAGGCGAWELAAGWSVIDLDDHNIDGGVMSNTIFGLNWYLSEFTRFAVNFIPISLDDPAVGKSRAFVIGTRFQASF